jgi:branched-chain amino acid transport system ATP-binding protein
LPLTAVDAGGTKLIEVADLTSGYGGVPVVRGIDLEVRPGEVVALLGPNGAGKTTTLLTISGIVRSIAGTINVLGQTVRGGRAPHMQARRGLAHVPEERSLFFGLTVRENLRLGFDNGRDRRHQDAYQRAISLFPALEPLMYRRAGLLSGGEQQMLAMARALVSDPKVLIIDELSLGLAPIVVERLLQVVREVVATSGVGVLLVEQHVHMALQVADRAYVMNNGRIVMAAPAAELANRQDLLAASYLGETALSNS